MKKKILKNQSKDGIWELRVLSTCSMNSQSLPCFSGINSLKNGKSGKIWHEKVGYIPLGGWILRNCLASLELEFTLFFWNSFVKKWKIGAKIGYDNIVYISLTVWILITYPVFLELIEIKMEDRVEDWIWKLRMHSTYGMNSQNLHRFSGIN